MRFRRLWIIGLIMLGGCDGRGPTPGPAEPNPPLTNTTPGANQRGDDFRPTPPARLTEPRPRTTPTETQPRPRPRPQPTYSWCTGDTRYRYAPGVETELNSFPDDYYAEPDATTLTGVRVRVDQAVAPWLAGIPAHLAAAYMDLSALDGWGTTAGIVLRFSAPIGDDLPSGATSTTNQRLRLVELSGTTAARVPFEVQTLDDGKTLVLWPLVPLKPKTRHAVVMTTQWLAADGACVAPSEALKAVLRGDTSDPRLQRLIPQYQTLLTRTGLAADAVSAAIVFTTQSIVEESRKIAKDIAGRSFSWDAPLQCAAQSLYRVCDGRFAAGDYRADGVVVDALPKSTYQIPVRIWLPNPPGGAPAPVIIFGHGLGGNRGDGQLVADLLADRGFAVVAIDAIAHGDHPAGSGGSSFMDLVKFLSFDLATMTINGLKHRDNWRQSTYDKLQLLAVLKQHPDVDGDGLPDLDLSRLTYIGGSLGCSMGPELLALNGKFALTVLAVGGGRLSAVVADTPNIKQAMDLVLPEQWTEDDLRRYFPVLQTLIERGDAANWAPHLLSDPFPGASRPHLLLMMSLGDDVVPNSATLMLARALNIPQLPPVLIDAGLIPTEATLPITGNWLPGSVTAGFFQYDRITTADGKPPIAVTHSGIRKGREFLLQVRHFLDSWLSDGLPEILDPYSVLGTPPLP